MTTAEEYRKMKASQTYEFVAHSGATFTLQKPGPTVTMEILSVTRTVAKKGDEQSAGMELFNQREKIYHAILPRYIVEPVVESDKAVTKKDSLKLSEISDDDKWGITQDLMNKSSGELGAARAESFPEDGEGEGAGDAGPTVETTGK